MENLTEPNRYHAMRTDHGMDSRLGVFDTLREAREFVENLPVTIGYRSYEIVDSFGQILYEET